MYNTKVIETLVYKKPAALLNKLLIYVEAKYAFDIIPFLIVLLLILNAYRAFITPNRMLVVNKVIFLITGGDDANSANKRGVKLDQL